MLRDTVHITQHKKQWHFGETAHSCMHYTCVLSYSIAMSCLVPQELLYEASATQFKCLNTEKSEHTKVRLLRVIEIQTKSDTNVNTVILNSLLYSILQRAISQIKADFESKLKFNTIYSSGTPSTQRVSTATSWHREIWQLSVHWFYVLCLSFYHSSSCLHVFPQIKAASLPTKMNRAFILRHGGLYDRQLELEMQRSIFLILLDCLKWNIFRW